MKILNIIMKNIYLFEINDVKYLFNINILQFIIYLNQKCLIYFEIKFIIKKYIFK